MSDLNPTAQETAIIESHCLVECARYDIEMGFGELIGAVRKCRTITEVQALKRHLRELFDLADQAERQADRRMLQIAEAM